MSPLIQRLDNLDGSPALVRGAKEQGHAKADRLLLTVLSLAVLTSAALPSLADALIWPIENRFERTILDRHQDIAGFIALGGGEERILEAARLARVHPGTKLVITGHGERAVILANQSGLPPDRIVIEPAAQNTFENAQFTAPLLEAGSARWVLVTSASHMPRAIGCFRKANVAIEAWPVPDVGTRWRDRLSSAMHEWLGMLAYRLRGRTDALFPASQGRPVERAVAAAKAQVTPITN